MKSLQFWLYRVNSASANFSRLENPNSNKMIFPDYDLIVKKIVVKQIQIVVINIYSIKKKIS